MDYKRTYENVALCTFPFGLVAPMSLNSLATRVMRHDRIVLLETCIFEVSLSTSNQLITVPSDNL